MKAHKEFAKLALVAMTGLTAADGHAADRKDEKNPNWPPSATKNTDTYYPQRAGLSRTPFVATRIDEISDVASNPRDAAKRIDATNRKTTPHDLDAYRKDGQSGIGYNRLSVDPRDSAADQTGHNLVAQGLAGNYLNTDPRALNYLSNAARAMNLGSKTRTWQWAFGSEKFIRIPGAGSGCVRRAMRFPMPHNCPTLPARWRSKQCSKLRPAPIPMRP